jgi:peptidoglycan/LPS O-acetylase OafA/YrhL
MNTIDKLNYSLISKYRTVLMGIAIILIMFCHMDVAQGNNGVPVTSVARALHIFTVGVDIFMFLSGFGLYYSYTKSKPSYREFESKRLIRILPKYLIIGGATYAIYDLILHQFGFFQFLSDLTFVSWIRGESTKYWYILAIIVFYLIFPALFRFVYSGKHGLQKIIGFSLCWWIVEELLSEHIAAVGNFRIALARLPIFIIGIYCGSLSYEKKELKKSFIAMMLVFGYLLFIVMKITALKPIAEYFYYPGRAALAVSIMITVIGLLEMFEKYIPCLQRTLIKVLGWFGGITLELYLLHQSYMILLEYPYKLTTYPIAAFILPTLTAAAIDVVRMIRRKRKVV